MNHRLIGDSLEVLERVRAIAAGEEEGDTDRILELVNGYRERAIVAINARTATVPLDPSADRLLAGVKAFQHARATDNLSDWRAFYRAVVAYEDAFPA